MAAGKVWFPLCTPYVRASQATRHILRAISRIRPCLPHMGRSAFPITVPKRFERGHCLHRMPGRRGGRQQITNLDGRVPASHFAVTLPAKQWVAGVAGLLLIHTNAGL